MNLPEMTPVSSSNVASVGYNDDTQELFVEFLNGSTYKYLEVPAGTKEAMLGSSSVGCYLNKQIKDRYAYEKVN